MVVQKLIETFNNSFYFGAPIAKLETYNVIIMLWFWFESHPISFLMVEMNISLSLKQKRDPIH